MSITPEDIMNMTDEERLIFYNAQFQKMDKLTNGALTKTTPFTLEEIENSTAYQRAYRMQDALMELRDWMDSN